FWAIEQSRPSGRVTWGVEGRASPTPTSCRGTACRPPIAMIPTYPITTERGPRFPFSSFHFHLQGRIAPLVVADADGVVHVGQKNLSIANLPRLRSFKNGLDGLFGEVVRDYHFNLDLGKQVNRILISTVKLGVSL